MRFRDRRHRLASGPAAATVEPEAGLERGLSDLGSWCLGEVAIDIGEVELSLATGWIRDLPSTGSMARFFMMGYTYAKCGSRHDLSSNLRVCLRAFSARRSRRG